jgi:hypothetical protein
MHIPKELTYYHASYKVVDSVVENYTQPHLFIFFLISYLITMNTERTLKVVDVLKQITDFAWTKTRSNLELTLQNKHDSLKLTMVTWYIDGGRYTKAPAPVLQPKETDTICIHTANIRLASEGILLYRVTSIHKTEAKTAGLYLVIAWRVSFNGKAHSYLNLIESQHDAVTWDYVKLRDCYYKHLRDGLVVSSEGLTCWWSYDDHLDLSAILSMNDSRFGKMIVSIQDGNAGMSIKSTPLPIDPVK